MRKKSVVLQEYRDKLAEQKGILAKGDALSVEELSKAEIIDTEIDALETELKSIKVAEDLAKKNAERATALGAEVTSRGAGTGTGTGAGNTDDDEDEGETNLRQNSRSGLGGGYGARNGSGRVVSAARHSRVSAFTGTLRQRELKAYRFGMFFLASIAGSEHAREYCKANGIQIKSHNEGTNSSGGFLVPEEFDNDMIILREEYGVIRRLAKQSTMRSDTKTVARRTGGLKAYFVGEGNGIAESRKGWDRVNLTAKKLAVLAIYTNELSEDAVIDIGNDMADEIAYAFAQMEDDCGFNGDGTAAYGKIEGAAYKILSVDPTPANIKGLYVTTATDIKDLVLGDWSRVKKLLPRYARNNAAWYVNQAIFDDSMERLAIAAGGVTAAEVAAGLNEDKFLGKPVEVVQALTDDPAPGQIFALFGDLRKAMLFGDRRQMTLAMSEHANFAEDEIAIRGTERFDINCHDVGDTVKAGPLVAIALHA